MNKKNENRKAKTGTAKTSRWKALRAQLMSAAVVLSMWLNGFYCMAAANYGEKAGSWLLDQLFWIGLVVMAIILLGCLSKRAWMGALITAVAGAVVLVFIKNPQILSSIGDNIVNNVFK